MRVFSIILLLLAVLVSASAVPVQAHPQTHQLPFCGDEDEANIVDSCIAEWGEELVPGWVVGEGASRSVTFDYIHRGGTFSNELSVVQTDNDKFQFVDAGGEVIDPEAQPDEWRTKAIEVSQVVFSGGSSPGAPDNTIELEGSWVLMLDTGRETFFTNSAVNPVGTLQTRTYRNNANQAFWQIGFEDLPGTTGDYDDIVVTMLLDGTPPPPATTTTTTTPPVTSPPTEPGPLSYVALGDSFSSGEGTNRFNLDQSCRRGTSAWPYLMAEASDELELVDFRACSGDKIQDIISQLPSTPRPDVDLVTVTGGINNTPWADIIAFCVANGPKIRGIQLFGGLNTCADAYDVEEIAKGIQQVGRDLGAFLYPAVTKAYPNAKIVHVTYPYVVPPFPNPDDCGWLQPDEQSFLTNGSNLLHNATVVASRSFDNVDVVNGLSTLAGHEACSPKADDWVYKIKWKKGGDDNRAHPNEEGQRAVSQFVLRELGL